MYPAEMKWFFIHLKINEQKNYPSFALSLVRTIIHIIITKEKLIKLIEEYLISRSLHY